MLLKKSNRIYSVGVTIVALLLYAVLGTSAATVRFILLRESEPQPSEFNLGGEEIRATVRSN